MTSEDLSLSDPSSDESLSLSSASDEAFSQDEWAVRRILAEAKVQGEIKYLIDWDGFDLCDATWEPAEHLSEGLLADWLTTKKKTGKKTVPGFKIDEWRQAVNDDIRAKYAKHTKRNQQRARLGLGQSELDFTLEQWINSVQGPSEDDTTDTNEEHIQEKYSAPVSEPPTTEPRIIGQSSARINDQSKEQKARSSLRESQGIQDDRTLSIKEGSVLQFECQTSHGPPESPQDSPENEKKSPVQAAQAGLCALDSQKSTLSSTPKSKGAPHQPDSLPKTTVRFRIPSVGSALMPNVFVGGKKRKARQNLLDAASDPSRPPKFLNHHKQRLIEKGLRDKEGVTPPRKEGNEPLRVHPIQAAMQPINTMPTSGKIRGILVPRNSLDRVIPKPSPKKKRVHWEDDLISQKPQIPAELESLFVSDEPSIVALNADFCAMGASTESPSKGAPSFSSAELPPSCDRSTISKPCQFGSPDGLFATPWKNMELLIWDPLIRNSVFQGNEFYEGELLSAQERLVSYIVDRSQDLKTTLPLERVWVGPFDDHQDDGFVDPFDCVLSWIRTISNSVKERLPLYGKQLSSRGWKQVDLEDLLTRAGEGNVPRQISETQSANKQCLPLRTVFQAPKPNIGARRSPTCNNRLQAAMLRHQDSNEIYFTFQPTLKWYGEQVAAGRGLQHIKVLDWQTFFTRHKIHDPED
ncbi:hypothetical protein H634G_01480 [Metarhizium anisopliae BRIP 53293]|uniref:Chromo domain-containing protein n=1 Tax=Metarhizium anisopliae BRIP 53293 TaxID=1291518 RepID=A0A0D9PB82_METAN|nr:hypothetical protein H634G_01480 [Metarhizium anisopliae BRIP 53293]KJK91006.1 hypothetical protein H633G_05139 [Metarhizium anisopliae BRIP 53284]